jgi:hypothetical protein
VGSSVDEHGTITRPARGRAGDAVVGLFGKTSADGAWLGANVLDTDTQLLVVERERER